MAISNERVFGSVLTAMVTPMHDDGSIDYEGAAAVAKHLVANGHDGIVVSGTTGESPTTHGPEKARLIETVRDVIGPDIHLVAGIGSNDTAHTVRMTKEATKAGATGLLLVTPYYSKPSQRGVIAHAQAVADASDLPIMLYDIPGRSGIRLAPDTLDALAQIPTVKGVKDATGDIYGAIRTMERTGLVYYSGDDGLNLGFLTHGGVGVVSVAGHVTGNMLRDMIDALDAGNLPAARAAFVRQIPVIEAIMGTGLGAVMAKAACQIAGVISSRALRLPNVAATDDEVAALRQVMVAAGLVGADESAQDTGQRTRETA